MVEFKDGWPRHFVHCVTIAIDLQHVVGQTAERPQLVFGSGEVGGRLGTPAGIYSPNGVMLLAIPAGIAIVGATIASKASGDWMPKVVWTTVVALPVGEDVELRILPLFLAWILGRRRFVPYDHPQVSSTCAHFLSAAYFGMSYDWLSIPDWSSACFWRPGQTCSVPMNLQCGRREITQTR